MRNFNLESYATYDPSWNGVHLYLRGKPKNPNDLNVIVVTAEGESMSEQQFMKARHEPTFRLEVEEAQKIDRENGNTLWWDVIFQEMKNVRVDFEEYYGDIDNLKGYQQIDCHMIFDML